MHMCHAHFILIHSMRYINIKATILSENAYTCMSRIKSEDMLILSVCCYLFRATNIILCIATKSSLSQPDHLIAESYIVPNATCLAAGLFID